MALTPEDVVNKRFQPTKFREGYDQDEVDDFLDEVVVELRRLNQENEEVRQRLVQADARINELQRGAGAQPAAQQASFTPQQPEAPQAPPAFGAAPGFGAAPAFGAAPTFGAAPAFGATPDSAGDPNNLLQLARKLHEEHVREGVEKRDALIAEGYATAARVVAEAETRQRQQLSSLDQERQALESRVNDLRNFEREYRQKLKGYIEGQLRELESAAIGTTDAGSNQLTAAGAPSASAPPSATPPGYYVPQAPGQLPGGNYTGFAGS